MFIEFLDQLRCIEPHQDSWLVASFEAQQDRFILHGTLGCPICFREYPLRNGIAYFGVNPETVNPSGATQPAPMLGDPEAATHAAMRAAAFLDAREQSTLVLAGQWAPHAHEVTNLMPTRIFAVNPAQPMDDAELVAVLYAADAIPLTPGSVDGVALDSTTATEATLRAALHVLRPGGRLVAPAETPVPAGVQELARDDAYWVGETNPALVLLRRS